MGTYTGGDSGRIYTCSIDAETGPLESVDTRDADEYPSFLAAHPSGE